MYSLVPEKRPGTHALVPEQFLVTLWHSSSFQVLSGTRVVLGYHVLLYIPIFRAVLR